MSQFSDFRECLPSCQAFVEISASKSRILKFKKISGKHLCKIERLQSTPETDYKVR